ncbi:MAG: hypothetical protein E6I08_02200 [Chloroflexi bacterium]|nr:MAG: hypothetical protein E6I08_02200 [Chloroflexota bacterium]
MTARRRQPRQQPELDGYDDLIARARAGVRGMSTPELVRIRELLERILEGGGGDAGEGRKALAELARRLRRDA